MRPPPATPSPFSPRPAGSSVRPGAGPCAPRPAKWSSSWPTPSRCRVILVTLPEEMPVSETIESAFTLEDKAGVQLGPVIVNATDPDPVGLERSAREAAAGLDVDPDLLDALEEARQFRLQRHALSASQIERLARDLPLPQLLVPTVDAEDDRSGRDRPLGLRPGPRRSASSRPRSRPHERRGDGRPRAPQCARHRTRGHRVLRFGRRRQDDRLRHLRPGRGPGGTAGLRGHRRPGPPPGRLLGRAVPPQHADRGRQATGRVTSMPSCSTPRGRSTT